MSQSEMDRFMGDVKKSPDMQEKMKSFGDDFNGAVTYAQSLGYDVTAQDGASSSSALSDSDLDSVAGGGRCSAGVSACDPTYTHGDL